MLPTEQGHYSLLSTNKEELTEVKSILCDGGYRGKSFADKVKAVLGEKVTVQVVKRNELHTFKSNSQTVGGRTKLCLA